MDSVGLKDLQSKGQELYAAGDYKAAAVSFRELTEVNPVLADNWRLRGFAEHASQDFGGAVESFSKACKLDPNSAENQFGLGSAYMGLGNWDAAVNALDESLRIRPDHTYAKRTLVDALMQRAQAFIAVSNNQYGEHDLDRAIKLDRKNPVPVMTMVGHLLSTGQQSRAVKILQTALLDLPNDPGVQAAAAQLNVKVQAAAVVDAQRRDQVKQSQEVPCPICKKMVMQWASVCPYCSSVIKQIPSQFAGRDTGPAYTWQEAAYKVMAVVWMLLGAWSIFQGVMLTRREGYIPGMESFFVIVGTVQIGVGIGLLTENEVMQFITKIFCYLTFVRIAFGFMLGGSLIKGFVIEALITMVMAGFQLYLLREVAGE